MDDIINFLIYYSNLFWSLSYLFIYLFFMCAAPIFGTCVQYITISKMSNGGGSFRTPVEWQQSCFKNNRKKCFYRTLYKINFNKSSTHIQKEG